MLRSAVKITGTLHFACNIWGVLMLYMHLSHVCAHLEDISCVLIHGTEFDVFKTEVSCKFL